MGDDLKHPLQRVADAVEEARTRLATLCVLFTWAFFHIALTLVLVTFSIKIPHLSFFIFLIFFSLLIMFASRSFVVQLYTKLSDKIVMGQISRSLNAQQIRENTLSIQMLRNNIQNSTIPKLVCLFTMLVYAISLAIFNISFSIWPIAFLLLLLFLIIFDEFLLGHRIATGRYADNETEIRELLAWIDRNRRQGRNGGGPPALILPSQDYRPGKIDAVFGAPEET